MYITELATLSVDDRIEVYTNRTGTYWGYVTAIHADSVEVDDIAPAGRNQPTTVYAEDIKSVVHRGRRPEGHIGVWRGVQR